MSYKIFPAFSRIIYKAIRKKKRVHKQLCKVNIVGSIKNSNAYNIFIPSKKYGKKNTSLWDMNNHQQLNYDFPVLTKDNILYEAVPVNNVFPL